MRYTIEPLEGFSNKIGELAFMLDHTRTLTLGEVSGFQRSDLDYLEDGSSNSIGALLYHIAAIEKVHQLITFENRDFTEEEFAEWGAAIELGAKARKEIKGKSLDFYLQLLHDTRNETLRLLREKEDSWLYAGGAWPNGVPFNHYYLWFHVMEDEISHRGQIRMMKKKLKKGEPTDE